MDDDPAEVAAAFVRYFEELPRERGHEFDPQCELGAAYARNWLALLRGEVRPTDASAVVAEMRRTFEGLDGYGSGWEDMHLRFEHWVRETGRASGEPTP